jgi:hypothetical protein
LGGGFISFHAMPPRPSADATISSPASRGLRAALIARRAIDPGTPTRSRTPLATSVTSEGSTSGVHVSAPIGVGVRDVSNSTVVRSTPETPSTSEWCVLLIKANRSSSSPCTSHSSHSGFVRSSRCEKIRPVRRRSCSTLPGAGSAVLRTW